MKTIKSAIYINQVQRDLISAAPDYIFLYKLFLWGVRGEIPLIVDLNVQIHCSLRQMPNTFEFKTYTFAPQLKTVDKLFLYCYNK